MKNEKTEKTEEETPKAQKTIGEYGYVRVNIFSDEFESVGVAPEMIGSEAMNLIREKLNLAPRTRARDPMNNLLKEAKAKAKADGKLDELQKIVQKFLQK